MTQYTPEVQALIDAVKAATDHYDNSYHQNSKPFFERLKAAYEALHPKPEMVRVVPDEMPDWFDDLYDIIEKARITKEAAWKNIVTLTMQPKPREVWKMPEWDQLPANKEIKIAEHSILVLNKTEYKILCNFIHAMNEEKK